MRRYIDAIDDILVQITKIHGNLSSPRAVALNEVKNILVDLRTLYDSEDELPQERKQRFELMHALLCKVFVEYENKKPMELSEQEIDNYLMLISQWFRERYVKVNSSPVLKYLYRKSGGTVLLGKNILVDGDQFFPPAILDSRGRLKGPAIIASTHHLNVEPGILQALTPYHMFWIGDVYLQLLGKYKRVHNVPAINWFLEKIGVIEVNREKFQQANRAYILNELKRLQDEVLRVLESGRIVGIIPSGHSGMEEQLFESGKINDTLLKTGNSGISFILKKVQASMGEVPVIPVGIRLEGKDMMINFGKPEAFSLQDAQAMKDFSNRLVEVTEALAQKKKVNELD